MIDYNSKIGGYFITQEGLDKETIRKVMAEILATVSHQRTPEILCALCSSIVYICVEKELSYRQIEIQLDKFKEAMLVIAEESIALHNNLKISTNSKDKIYDKLH